MRNAEKTGRYRLTSKVVRIGIFGRKRCAIVLQFEWRGTVTTNNAGMIETEWQTHWEDADHDDATDWIVGVPSSHQSLGKQYYRGEGPPS